MNELVKYITEEVKKGNSFFHYLDSAGEITIITKRINDKTDELEYSNTLRLKVSRSEKIKMNKSFWEMKASQDYNFDRNTRIFFKYERVGGI